MRVFQNSYRDQAGVLRKTRMWYIEFTDHLERRRRVSGLRDRRQTEAIGRNVEKLVRCKVSGEALDPPLIKWVETCLPALRARLGRIGLLDAGRIAALRPLLTQLDGEPGAPGFCQTLAAKGDTPRHVKLLCARVRRVIEGCQFTYWSDISPSRLTAYLADLREDSVDAQGNIKPGISAQTFNFYLAAFKQFCRWMVRDGRASKSPVAHLQGLNVRTDRRHDRRALSVKEVRWLLETTRSEPRRFGMTGPQRAMLYRLAIETGLRAGELASLTAGSFDLSGARPTVTVLAGYSKRRREDVLALRPDTAAELRDALSRMLPHVKAFNVPDKTSKMFRADLAAARTVWLAGATTAQERRTRERSAFLSFRDGSGRVADFHALRHTAGSLLAASGAHPKVAQAIMRHSDINLTLSRYSHIYAGQEADAVAALPDLSLPAEQADAATGTDGRTIEGNLPADTHLPDGQGHGRQAVPKTLARNLAHEGGFQRTSAVHGGLEAQNDDSANALENIGQTACLQGKMNTSARSSAGQSIGFLNRRSEVRVLSGVLADRAACPPPGLRQRTRV